MTDDDVDVEVSRDLPRDPTMKMTIHRLGQESALFESFSTANSETESLEPSEGVEVPDWSFRFLLRLEDGKGGNSFVTFKESWIFPAMSSSGSLLSVLVSYLPFEVK